MCGCNLNNKSDKIVVSIDRDKLMQGDMYNVALLGFASNPKQFEDKLNALGLKFDDDPYEDIKFFARLNELGQDVKGMLADSNSNPIIFDFKEFLKGIEVLKQEDNPIKIDFV